MATRGSGTTVATESASQAQKGALHSRASARVRLLGGPDPPACERRGVATGGRPVMCALPGLRSRRRFAIARQQLSRAGICARAAPSAARAWGIAGDRRRTLPVHRAPRTALPACRRPCSCESPDPTRHSVLSTGVRRSRPAEHGRRLSADAAGGGALRPARSRPAAALDHDSTTSSPGRIAVGCAGAPATRPTGRCAVVAVVSGRPRSAGAAQLLRRAGITGWSANVEIRDADGADRCRRCRLRPTSSSSSRWTAGRFTRRRERFQRDRQRQNRLIAAGWTVLRFTWRDLIERPGLCDRDDPPCSLRSRLRRTIVIACESARINRERSGASPLHDATGDRTAVGARSAEG